MTRCKKRMRWLTIVLFMILAAASSKVQVAAAEAVALKNDMIEIPKYHGLKIEDKEQLLEAVVQSSKLLAYDETANQAYVDEVWKTYQELAKEAGYQEADFDTFLEKELGISAPELERELLLEREQNTKEKEVVKLIAEAEKLTISEELYQEKRLEYATEQGYEDGESFEEYLGRTNIEQMILRELVQDHLLETAVTDSSDGTEKTEEKKETKRVDLNIVVRNQEGSELENAKLELYKNRALTEKVNYTKSRTDKNGELKIAELEMGTYYLSQTEASIGYRSLSKPIEIKIYKKAGQLALKANGIDDKDITYTEKENGSDTAYITIYNKKGIVLPGGDARMIVVLVLMLLFGIMTFIIYINRRRKRQHNPLRSFNK